MTLAGVAHQTGIAGILATAASSIIDPQTVEQIGSIPLGVAALLVTAYAVHTSYKASIRSSEAQEKSAEAVRSLAEKLGGCPHNTHGKNVE
jgi:hypothetical protein